MSLINGLTEILKGSGNNDIDGINVYVTNSSAIPVEDSEAIKILEELKNKFSTGSVSSSESDSSAPKVGISLNPSPSDFTSMTSLEEIVPSGFLLIHNDIVALSEKLKESSGGGGLLGGLLSGGAAGLGAGIGAFAAGGLSSFIGTLFSGTDDETTAHMNDIITELNLSMTADDFKEDPEVKTAQKDAFLQYLKTYYFQQTSALAGSSVGGAVANVVSSFIGGTIGKLFNFNKDAEETPSKLAEMAKELDKDLTKDSVLSVEGAEEEIKQIQYKSVIAYLKTYYAGQIAELGGDAAGSTVGSFIGSVLKTGFQGLIEGTLGTVLDLFGKNGSQKEAEGLEKIALELTNAIKVEDYAQDKDILDVQKNAIVQYVKSYYQAQISEFTADADGKNLSNRLSSTIQGLTDGILKGVFGLFLPKESESSSSVFVSKLETLVSTLDTNMNAAEYADDANILDAQKQSVIEYVKSYYDLQVSQFQLDATKTNISSAISGTLDGIISGIFGGLFGNKTQESQTLFSTKINDIISVLDSNISTEGYIDQISEIQKSAVLEYLRVYYDSQVSELKNKDSSWYENLAAAIGSGINKFFTSLFGVDEESATTSQFIQAVESLAVIDVNTFDKSSLDSTKQDAVNDAIASILEAENKAISDKFSVSINKSDLNESFETFNASYVDNIRSLISSLGFEKTSSIENTQRTHVLEIIEDILDKENSAILRNFSPSSNREISNALSSFKTEYLNNISNYLKTDDSSSQFSSSSSERSSLNSNEVTSIRSYTSQINSTLLSILSIVSSIAESNGSGSVVVVNNNTTSNSSVLEN